MLVFAFRRFFLWLRMEKKIVGGFNFLCNNRDGSCVFSVVAA